MNSESKKSNIYRVTTHESRLTNHDSRITIHVSQEFGEIKEKEVFEAALSGKTIETYPEDEPYPSCLIYGRTSENRPIHIVCAYSKESDIVIIITVYQPDPERWIDFERRRI